MGGPPGVEAWAAEGGYKVAVYRETKSGNRYRKLVAYGEGTPLDAGILWTKRRPYAVLWGVRGRRSDAADVAAAVQRVLDSAQEGQGWPEEMPEGARRQVISGDGKCLYWALSAVDGAGGRAAAEEVRKALTEGEMARPPESGWVRRVMRDAGARTWDQYLDKVRMGEIWGGACEVGRWAQSKGCRVPMYQEWGPQGVYRKMAEVGEGKRTAAALPWSRRGGGHYELLWPPGEEDAEAVAGADAEEGTESKGDAEVTMEEELAEEGPEKGGGGKGADGGAHVAGCASNTDPGGGGEVEVPGTGGPREGEEGSGRGYSARQKTTGGMGSAAKSASTGDGVYGSARGYGERRVAQEAGRGGGRVGHRGGEAVLQPQHREDVGTGCGAERAVQIRPDRAVWLEPGWKGRYRVMAGGRRWWGWQMTWRATRERGSQSGMSGEESCQEEDRRRVAWAHSSLGRH